MPTVIIDGREYIPKPGAINASLQRETDLVGAAEEAISAANWTVGQCASIWLHRRRGRSESEFAEVLGLTVEQVVQRHLVWVTFSDVAASYPSLLWSHFQAALKWKNPTESLAWANANVATVGEMKAYHSAQNGYETDDE